MDRTCVDEKQKLQDDLGGNVGEKDSPDKSQRIRCRLGSSCKTLVIAVLVCAVIALIVLILLMRAKIDQDQTSKMESEAKNTTFERAKNFTIYGDPHQALDKPQAEPLVAGLVAKAGLGSLANKVGTLAKGPVGSAVAGAAGKGVVSLVSGRKKSTVTNNANTAVQNQGGEEPSTSKNQLLESLRQRIRESKKDSLRFFDKYEDGAYRNLHLEAGYDKDLKFTCQGEEPKNTFPNIDYALFGYDTFKGYPLSNIRDPGFTFPIFSADYSDGHHTDDCRFHTPTGLIAVTDVSCLTSYSTEAFLNLIELERGFDKYASSEVNIFIARFRANADYRKAMTILSRGEHVYVLSTAMCNYYFSKMQTENPPPFDATFLEWAVKLQNTSDDETYVSFLSKFGTHYVKEMAFGARVSYLNVLTKKQYQVMVAEGFDVSAGSSSGPFFEIKAGSGNETFYGISRTAMSQRQIKSSLGIPPPSDENQVWASKVHENPMPLSYKLERIENLFRPDLMPGTVDALMKVSQRIAQLKDTYFEKLMSEAVRGEYFSSGRWITKTLNASNGGKEGQWYPPEFCPKGYFAVGYKMKVEHYRTDHDNTALNAVNLLCGDKNGQTLPVNKGIQSGSGHRGLWTASVKCTKSYFLQQFKQFHQLPEHEGGNPDDSSINFVDFGCNDMTRVRDSIPLRIELGFLGANSHFGKWSESCPQGSAVCGIQTRIDEFEINTDNTGLNDIKLMCCEDDS